MSRQEAADAGPSVFGNGTRVVDETAPARNVLFCYQSTDRHAPGGVVAVVEALSARGESGAAAPLSAAAPLPAPGGHRGRGPDFRLASARLGSGTDRPGAAPRS